MTLAIIKYILYIAHMKETQTQMDRKFITPEQAISILPDGDRIHTFRNPNGFLLGCDWDRKDIIDVLNNNPDKIEIGGEQCRRMKHALVIDHDGLVFIETDEEKLNKIDPI